MDSNERHGQVARNTLITSVVIESVIVSTIISFVVVVRIPPVVRPRLAAVDRMTRDFSKMDFPVLADIPAMPQARLRVGLGAAFAACVCVAAVAAAPARAADPSALMLEVRAAMLGALRDVKSLPRDSRGFGAARASIGPLLANASRLRGAAAGPDGGGAMLNVLVAAHSHCDVGWQVTPPKYYGVLQ